MEDPISEAAITGASLVRHLEDARFATLRALRQLLRALNAERIAVGLLTVGAAHIHEELVWVSGSGRCGESERVISCASFMDELRIWLDSPDLGLSIGIDAGSPAWHALPCDQLLLVRRDCAVPDRPLPVLVAQLRGAVRLTDSATHAISVLLREHAAWRDSAAPVG